MFAANGVVEAF